MDQKSIQKIKRNGRLIAFEDGSGHAYRYIKRAPAYQFKRPWWQSCERNAYIPASRIPESFRVVERGA